VLRFYTPSVCLSVCSNSRQFVAIKKSLNAISCLHARAHSNIADGEHHRDRLFAFNLGVATSTRYMKSLAISDTPFRCWSTTTEREDCTALTRHFELHLQGSSGASATFATVVRDGGPHNAVSECFVSAYVASETAPTRILDVHPTTDGKSLLFFVL
jgi:hypothetical protein